MEIKYPIIIVFSIIVFVIAFFVSKRFRLSEKAKNKNKIANTSIVKRTRQFQDILKKYRIILYLLYVLILFCVIGSSILSSRIVEEKVTRDKQYNRDIMLCMDVSGSVLDLNKELVNTYKDIVKNLNGERFGISIFNTNSVLLVPLTTDYDYVLESLDLIGKSIDILDDYTNNSGTDIYDTLYLLQYISEGTTEDYESRGSSLAGDGLAACVFDFPHLEEERSRIIIYSTDNEVVGTEFINVTDAAALSKNKGIKVYAIGPENTYGKDGEDLKKAAISTGGKLYLHNSGPTVKSIVNEIEQTEKSELEGPAKATIIDHPTVPFIITLVAFFVLIIIDKVVLS